VELPRRHCGDVTAVVGPEAGTAQVGEVRTAERTFARRVRDVLAVGRPAFWPVSLLPYYVGILLATHRLIPPMERWPQLLPGAVVIGPLLWLAVLAINDAYDLTGDLLNPRKSKSPLLDGRISLPAARQSPRSPALPPSWFRCTSDWPSRWGCWSRWRSAGPTASRRYG
jgi:hypothetical protein